LRKKSISAIISKWNKTLTFSSLFRGACMSSEVQTVKNTKFRTVAIILSILVTFILVSLVAWQYYMKVYFDENINKDVYIRDTYVGSMSRTAAIELLKAAYSGEYENKEMTVKCSFGSKKFYLTDIDYTYDYESAVDQAYAVGRTSNIFKNIISILFGEKQPVNIDLNYTYSKEKLSNIINGFSDETKADVKHPIYLIDEDNLSVASGHAGLQVSAEEAVKLVSEAIENKSFGEVEIPEIVTSPESLDTEAIYNEICKDPINASYTKDGNTVTVVPHKYGRTIDKQVLEDFLARIQETEDTTDILSLDSITPSLLDDDAQNLMLKDVLSSFYTIFDLDTENNRNRAINIKLAGKALSGHVLLPGEIFSFNKVVGPRTAAKGYTSAEAYSAGKIIETTGGGICQVSSTIYNAVLRAGLEVVERSNHQFTVNYVPLGFDAAVSYDVQDIKFRNSTNYPIKIEVTFPQENKIQVQLVGTKTSTETTYEFTSKTIKHTPFSIINVEDHNLSPGKSMVKEYGKDGYIVDSYKIVKVNGVEVDRIYLHRSTYNPYAQIVHRNTLPVQPDPTDPSDPTNPPDPTEPTNPTDPTEPTGPDEPAAPADPTDPTDPTGGI
jgi:vancomycin resistance protein YoaR